MFDARAAAAKVTKLPPFDFTGLDGVAYTLPNVKTLSTAQGDRFNNNDSTVLAEIASPEAYAAIMAMPIGVGEDLAMAWLEHGGELGKEPSES